MCSVYRVTRQYTVGVLHVNEITSSLYLLLMNCLFILRHSHLYTCLKMMLCASNYSGNLVQLSLVALHTRLHLLLLLETAIDDVKIEKNNLEKTVFHLVSQLIKFTKFGLLFFYPSVLFL